MNKMGFGFLRLPKTGEDYDWKVLNEMVDLFLERGGRYFDTCYTYLNGNSELGLRRCLTERHSRDSYELAEKLPGYNCKSYEDCFRFFEEEQERCGVKDFDVYLLHWLNGKNYELAEKYDEFRFLRELKAKGLTKRIGFSYHDSASLLDRILKAHPEVDLVQLQLNYLDWESAGIQSRQCYETCVRHGKKVVVMEPIKGGTLANLPAEAEKLLRAAHGTWSNAEWALRFVQSLPQVEICLSGMSSLSQVEENMREVETLTAWRLSFLVRSGASSNPALPYPVPDAAIARATARSVFPSPIISECTTNCAERRVTAGRSDPAICSTLWDADALRTACSAIPVSITVRRISRSQIS